MAYLDAVTRLGPGGSPRPQYTGFAASVSAAITGTSLNEAQIVAGGETIVITLTADTWVASGATFNAQRQNIIDGLDSAEAEATGWNAVVRDAEVVTAVVRTSDTVVTITLTAAPTYDVTANETITVTVPASALVTSASAVIATPTIGVAPSESAVLTGDLSGGALENDVASKWQNLRITLTGETWKSGQDFSDALQDIINGLTSSGTEATGWNAEVRDRLSIASITRVSDTVIRMDLPASSGYAIDANETITYTVPASAIAGSSAITATPTITITAAATSGTSIVNSGATATPSNYEISDRSGFRVLPGDLEKDGHIQGMMVRKKEYDDRHPQERVRARGESLRGPQSPELDSKFLSDGDVTADDL